MHHYPRQHGSATGANLKVILRAFNELLRLRLRIHDWKPALPESTESETPRVKSPQA